MAMRLVVASMLLLVAAGSHAAEPLREVPINPDVGVYAIGNYRYVLSVAIDNEGRMVSTGALLRDALPIAGDDYFRLELPIGSFIWHPPYAGAAQQGWQRIDGGKKHPEWYMAVIEPPAKDARYLRTRMRDPLRTPAPATVKVDPERPTNQ